MTQRLWYQVRGSFSQLACPLGIGLTFTVAAILATAPLRAQSAEPPKVLSTVPDPPAGAVAEPAQMSGMPLQVGDLPPGVIVVRVIRRSFAENVANQRVDLRVGARSISAVTDASGRAQFNAQPVGVRVMATATVDGERLDSQEFEIPAQGGVRMVLVAGVGAGVPAGSGAPLAPVLSGAAAAGSAGPPAAPSAVPLPSPPLTGGGDDVFTISIRRSTLTLLAGFIVLVGVAFVWLGWTRRSTRSAGGDVASSSLGSGQGFAQSAAGGETDPSGAARAAARDLAPDPDLRRRVLQELAGLERDLAAGRVTEEGIAARREALLSELVQLDAAADRVPA
jgi:hypothetical protein